VNRLSFSKKFVTISQVALLIGLPAVAEAETLCGNGLIQMLLLPADGHPSMRLSFVGKVSPENVLKYDVKPGLPPMISIWESNGPARWNKKVDALQFAFAMQLPVRITSPDVNCMGGQDEFEIVVCQPDGDCPVKG
jgi:hypothetical protein